MIQEFSVLSFVLPVTHITGLYLGMVVPIQSGGGGASALTKGFLEIGTSTVFVPIPVCRPDERIRRLRRMQPLSGLRVL
jgi:hypothetical protein